LLDFLGNLLANDLNSFRLGNVLIMFTLFGLGARRPDRAAFKPLTLLHSSRDLHTVDCARFPVLAPSGASNVASDDGLERDEIMATYQHASS
jgi:hypothetical protein